MEFARIQKMTREIKQIAKKYGISRVYVFGSTVRGEATDQSDVDFLVEMQEGASLFGVGGFSYETEKLLGVRVDVVPSSALPLVSNQDFVENIKKEAISL
jgi:predicted nucleotidyltransferase